nr:MAG TPA: zinc finger protein [Caudoviricetes sp.]
MALCSADIGIVSFEFEPNQAVYFMTCRCSYHNKEIYGLLGNSAHCAYR